MKKFYAIKSKRIGYLRYIRTFFGISLGKRIFSNVYEMKGTQTVLIGISTWQQAFKTYNI